MSDHTEKILSSVKLGVLPKISQMWVNFFNPNSTACLAVVDLWIIRHLNLSNKIIKERRCAKMLLIY